MSELIDRQEVIKALCERRCGGKPKGCPSGFCTESLAVDCIPSAQPERKRGKWIDEAYDPFATISGRCSVCGWEAHLYEDDVVGMNYCPNCGARMDEFEEE